MDDVPYPPSHAPMKDSMSSHTKAQLGKEAIRFALNGQWEQAVATNQQILDVSPTDCEASNRLAKAQMELGNFPDARRTLEELRLHSPANVIARKNLARLDRLQNRCEEARSLPAATGRSPRMFIAESGKSCSTTLCKQTGLSDTPPVSAGDVVLLTTKDDGVTVNTLDGAYLGTLQRRLGRRLNRLMSGGNRYEAAVVGLEEAGLSIILRETGQAPALRHVVSFPSQASESHQLNPIAEPDQIVPSLDEESDQVPSDAIDADDISDSVENAVLNMHDDTSVESVGIDDVPTLDTDEDVTAWSPVTPPSEDEEERD